MRPPCTLVLFLVALMASSRALQSVLAASPESLGLAMGGAGRSRFVWDVLRAGGDPIRHPPSQLGQRGLDALRTQFEGPQYEIVSRSVAKCGTTKQTGKSSCCAPGGSWFQLCGNAGDANFEHTWAEGIQVCKGFASSLSGEVQTQVILRPKSTQAQPNATRGQNGPQRDTVGSIDDDKSDAAATDNGELTKTISFTLCFAFINIFVS